MKAAYYHAPIATFRAKTGPARVRKGGDERPCGTV